VAAAAEALDTRLMPWQTHVAAVALEHDAGRLAYRDVVLSTPRQSGKSTLILAVLLARMLSAPGQTCVYGAQNRLSARTRLFDKWWPRIRRSPLREMFTLSRATGAEALRCVNGSTLYLLSVEESAGHGETLDLGVIDECWSLEQRVEQAVRPAMATRPNAQLWMASTAGTATSVWWRDKVDAGRTSAQLGVTEGLCYLEWSAAEDTDVSDPATWPSFMPALGITITPETVQRDLATMRLQQWRRAYANQWPDECDEGWSVIGRDLWAGTAW
jgi:phage terminase large subunit-like protein